MRLTGRSRWAALIVPLACLGLVGCPGSTKPPAIPASTRVPAGLEGIPAGAIAHRIDAAASGIAIEVYRGGPLASMGHNHVITATEISGHVYLAPVLAQSAFDLEVPISSLVVDDPDARRAAGEGFPPDLPAEARQATRRNMLGVEVLAADDHPTVRLRSVAISGDRPQLRVTAAMTLRGVTREIEVPVDVQSIGGPLRLSGAFALRQSDYGITPFSVALGALTVRDEVRIRFDLVAIPQSH